MSFFTVRRAIVLLLVYVALLPSILAKTAPTKLQVGVKKRVDPCPTRKSSDGDRLSMHYVGTLWQDGTKFDSSRDRSQPFEFVLGTGQVIKGWDQGLRDMCPGEIRKLTIPYSLAYGADGIPPTIPPKADLVFEVELLKIVNLSDDDSEDLEDL